MIRTWWRLRDAVAAGRRRGEDWLLSQMHAPHALAACRIAVGLSVLGLLASNFGNRQVWVGDASAWAEPARDLSRFPEIALLDGVSGDLLTFFYVVLGLAALALTLGWHAKAATVVTLVGFIAVTAQNPLLGTSGDNLVRLVLLWLLLVQASLVWSLDAAREGPRDTDVTPPWLRTGLHNVGLLGLGAQTALAYTAGGLDKVSQSSWQRGTALYTTLQLPEFRPFPWLSDLLSNATVLLALLTWTVLVVQLFFVPALLRSWSRDAVAITAIAVNLLFAVVLATPWTSLAVVAATGLFVSDARWARLGDRVADRAAPLNDRIVDGWYAVVDRVDDWWVRYVLRAVDWVRFTAFRR